MICLVDALPIMRAGSLVRPAGLHVGDDRSVLREHLAVAGGVPVAHAAALSASSDSSDWFTARHRLWVFEDGHLRLICSNPVPYLSGIRANPPIPALCARPLFLHAGRLERWVSTQDLPH